MELITKLLLLVAIAVAITGGFVLLFRTDGPFGSKWSFFIMLFMVLWAASIWIVPIGPVYFGLAWVPMLIVGVLLGFLFLAATPEQYFKRNKNLPHIDEGRTEKAESFSLAMNIFFWLAIGILLVSIGFSYW